MKRRTFVKKSVAASILTPLALTGLINAAGAEGGETNVLWTGTTFTGPDDWTWYIEETTSMDDTSTYVINWPNNWCVFANHPAVKWVYIQGVCYKFVELSGGGWCVVRKVACDPSCSSPGMPPNLTCEEVRRRSQRNGRDKYLPGYIRAQNCHLPNTLP
jgi:hypothetical protein